MFNCSPQKFSTPSSIGDLVKNLIGAFTNKMSRRFKMKLVRYLYQQILIDAGGHQLSTFVGPNFLDVSLNAMRTLQLENKKNLIYDLSLCLQRSDNGDKETRMPMERMPFGLIDYNIRFFAHSSSQKLRMEEHYGNHASSNAVIATSIAGTCWPKKI